MNKKIKRIATSAVALTLAAGIAIMPASAVYYSNSFAIDATGERYSIPEAYRFYSVINRLDGGLGTLKSPTDICFDKNNTLYVVDQGDPTQTARVVIMDGDGKVKAMFADRLPDGSSTVIPEEEGGETVEEPEETPVQQEKIVTFRDEVVKDDLLTETSDRIEVGSLTEMQMALSRAVIEGAMNGSRYEGKTLSELTVVLTGDIKVATAADVKKFDFSKYTYNYKHYIREEDGTFRENTATHERVTASESIELAVILEVAEGSSLTVDTSLKLNEVKSIVNNGTLTVTSKGTLDVTSCEMGGSGTLVQQNGGKITGKIPNNNDKTFSVPEGTKATYTADEGWDVQFVYMYLNKPQGICVDDEGKIYICDTDNNRLIILNPDYSVNTIYTEEIIRQKASTFFSEDGFKFSPKKVGVNNTGMVYLLLASNYKGLFSMNKDGEFCGYVGATKTTASVTDVLVQIFGSARQKQALANRALDPAQNLYIVGNMIYTVIESSSTTKRIQKVNVVGSDLFPDGDYVITDYSTETQERAETNYVDICIDDYGIITVLDKNLGLIVQLNQLGEIVACFGGLSNRQGQFKMPSAMDINRQNRRIYVADAVKGSIQVFEPTEFIETVQEASQLYFEGLYGDAVGLWQDVAAIDETYDLAHVGIAESYYGDGYNKKAMDKFEYAWNYEGYDKAFSDFRLSLFRYYFAPIVISILAIVVLLAFGFVALKRKSDELYK